MINYLLLLLLFPAEKNQFCKNTRDKRIPVHKRMTFSPFDPKSSRQKQKDEQKAIDKSIAQSRVSLKTHYCCDFLSITKFTFKNYPNSLTINLIIRIS